MKVLLIGLLMMVTTALWAQNDTASSDVPARIAAERERLQQQRQAIEQADLERKRACWQRFAVNDCLREVRRQRYAELDPLRSQELELNAQERAWRTQERDERLREKTATQGRQP